MREKSFLIVEYAPSLLDNKDFAPVRMDGHYADQADAERIAKGWADETSNKGTRIVVVEVASVLKDPDSWKSN